jgi:hypothetical protein
MQELVIRLLNKNSVTRPSVSDIVKSQFLRPYMEAFILEQSNKFPRLVPKQQPQPKPEFTKSQQGFVYENDSLENSENEYEDDFESLSEDELEIKEEVCRAIEVY